MADGTTRTIHEVTVARRRRIWLARVALFWERLWPALWPGVFVAGVFVDPRIFPRGFIVLWTTILALVQILMGLALHDLLVVRRRAFEEKSRLLRENRKEMERELRDY